MNRGFANPLKPIAQAVRTIFHSVAALSSFPQSPLICSPNSRECDNGGILLLVAVLIINSRRTIRRPFPPLPAMLCLELLFPPSAGTVTIADPQNWVRFLHCWSPPSRQANFRIGSSVRNRKRSAGNADGTSVHAQPRHPSSRTGAMGGETNPHEIAQTSIFQPWHFNDASTADLSIRSRKLIQTSGEIENKLLEVASQSNSIEDKTARLTVTPIRLGGEPTGSLAIWAPTYAMRHYSLWSTWWLLEWRRHGLKR